MSREKQWEKRSLRSVMTALVQLLESLLIIIIIIMLPETDVAQKAICKTGLEWVGKSPSGDDTR